MTVFSRADRERRPHRHVHPDHCPEDAILGRRRRISAEGTSGGHGSSIARRHIELSAALSDVVDIDRCEDGHEITARASFTSRCAIFSHGERAPAPFRNGRRMHISNQETLDGSFLGHRFSVRANTLPSICANFQEVISVAKGVRRAGSAALDLAYTAAASSTVSSNFASLAVGHSPRARSSSPRLARFQRLLCGDRWLRWHVVAAITAISERAGTPRLRGTSRRRAANRALPSQ